MLPPPKRKRQRCSKDTFVEGILSNTLRYINTNRPCTQGSSSSLQIQIIAFMQVQHMLRVGKIAHKVFEEYNNKLDSDGAKSLLCIASSTWK